MGSASFLIIFHFANAANFAQAMELITLAYPEGKLFNCIVAFQTFGLG